MGIKIANLCAGIFEIVVKRVIFWTIIMRFKTFFVDLLCVKDTRKYL